MQKLLILLLVILTLSIPAAASGNEFRHNARTPQPRLIAPTTETVDLTGKKNLEFKWSSHEGRRGRREYYDFRLYKGYDMVEKSLLVKEKVGPGTYQVNIKSDMFEDGQIYTWSLRQVYDGLHKSNRSTASFKAIKK